MSHDPAADALHARSEHPPAAETVGLPADDDSARRLARDVALASELLGCGALSERQVSDTLADWSLYGSVSLRQHLQNTGLLSTEQLDALDERVARTLAATPLPEQFAPGDDPVARTVARFDSTGRVARALGLSGSRGDEAQGDGRSGVARYRIIRLLGQGGLGRVWLARDMDLQRVVALKEISATHENALAVQRFRNEAEITGRLEHPGIVPIYQLATDDGTGRAYYTMRFLGKRTLQNAIAEYHQRRAEGDDDPMLLRHLLTAFVSVCHAVGHAHSRKVIHRDLKPENVVIDSHGQVIVIDWGLAKVLDDAAPEELPQSELGVSVGRTSAGQVLGTPLYMAPEQAAGQVDDVDARTDIYGLGAILFSICTGRAPHAAAHARSDSSGARGPAAARELIAAVAEGPSPVATDIEPDLDPALAAICSKAMARRSYARYQDAADLAEDVQRWMAGEPVSAYVEPWPRQIRRWIGDHQRLSQGLAAALTILAATALTVTLVARQNRLAERESQFQRLVADAREVEVQIEGVVVDLGKQIRFVGSLPPIPGIIRARAAEVGDSNAGDSNAGDSEAVWSERLETIFLGLLRANPDYLAVTFVAAGAAPPADKTSTEAETPSAADEQANSPSHDVLRVERNITDRSILHSVPRSRLAAVDHDELLSQVQRQELGDVVYSLEPRLQQAAHATRTRRLIAAAPVFDSVTGAPFGMVMLEVDMNAKLLAVLQGIGNDAGDVFVAAGDGELWASGGVDREPTAAPRGTRLAAVCPEAADILTSTEIPSEQSDDASYYAKRFGYPGGKGIVVITRMAEPQ